MVRLKMKKIVNLFKTRSRVVLDIGTSSVKLVELAETPKGIKILKVQVAQIKRTEPGKPEGPQVIEAIKEVLSRANIKPRRVSIVGISNSVLVRYLSYPLTVEKRLNQVLRYDLESHIPFRAKEVLWDFQILQKEGEKEKIEVFLVAIKKNVVEKHLATIQEAGLTPKVIDINSLAPINSPLIDAYGEVGKITALLDLGASATILHLFKDRLPHFTKPISLTGDDLTSTIQEKLNLSFEEAERLKRKPTPEAKEAINAGLEKLAVEISRGLHYYGIETGIEKVDRVLLCGGGVRLREIDKFLSTKLGTEVIIPDPLTNIEIDPKTVNKEVLPKISPLLTAALGLALRKTLKLDLFPPAVRKAQKIRTQRKVFVLSTASLTIVLLLFSFSMITKRFVNARRIRGLEVAKIELGQKAVEVEKIKIKEEEINNKIALISQETSKQLLWSPILHKISQLTPAEVWLTSIQTVKGKETKAQTKKELKIDGVAPSHQMMTQFMSNLEDSATFTHITLSSSQEKRVRGNRMVVEFAISCMVKPGY